MRGRGCGSRMDLGYEGLPCFGGILGGLRFGGLIGFKAGV